MFDFFEQKKIDLRSKKIIRFELKLEIEKKLRFKTHISNIVNASHFSNENDIVAVRILFSHIKQYQQIYQTFLFTHMLHLFIKRVLIYSTNNCLVASYGRVFIK